MNINLVYEGKDYNFDIPNGVTIDYLKDLSSKIFNSEKEILDLIYNNEKLANHDNNTLIRDLIPDGETNAILTVQINKNLKNNKKNDNKNIIPLVSLKQRNENNNKNEKKSEENKINYNQYKNDENKEINKKMKEKKKIQIFDVHNITNNSYIKGNYKTNINNFNNGTNKEKVVFNEIIGKTGSGSYNYNNILEKDFNKKILFETAYNKNNSELLALIKEFSEKIKKLHSLLVKRIKNTGLLSNNISSSSNNNTSRSTINLSINNNYFYELSLYENKIINFQDKQIQFYKSILETMRKYDSTINFNKLSEFYNKLIIFTIGDNKNIFLKQLKPFKLTNIQNKQLLNSNSSINLSTLNSINNKKLPLLYNKNINSPLNNDKNKTLISNSVSRVNTKNITFQRISEHKDKKKSQKNLMNNINSNMNTNTNSNTNKILSKKSSYKEENNFFSNNTNSNNNNNNNNLNKSIKNNNIKNLNSKNNESEYDSSSDSNSDENIIQDTNKNNISPRPISLHKGIQLKNIVRKSDKFLNEKLKEDLLSQNNFGKSRIFNEKKIENTGIGINKNKKDVRIKEINVSNMTINDSNFAREKHSTPKKNRKESLNKYDFLL
jgi:hypothetical protein